MEKAKMEFDPGFHETMKRRLKWDTSLKNRKPYKILTNSSEMRDLIAEMLVKGATKEELDRAIEHSALVIDTERSEKENDILELKKKYMRNHEPSSTEIALDILRRK